MRYLCQYFWSRLKYHMVVISPGTLHSQKLWPWCVTPCELDYCQICAISE